MSNPFRYFLFSSMAAVLVGLGTATSYAQSAPSVENVKGEIDNVKGGNRDPFAKTEQKNFGITAGEWIILPELTLGALYNDNVFGSRYNTKGSWGFAVQPGVTIKRDTGIHDTTLSLFGDISTLLDVHGADTFSGAADLKHVYEIERGFTVTYQGEVARRQDQVSAYSATGTGSGAGLVYVQPVSYMIYSSSLDINKNFNDAFVGGGANILDFNYDNARTTTGITVPQGYRDLVEYSGHARAGLRFLSDGYVFIQPEVTQYDFRAGTSNATGYKFIGGVGTDRLSLFRGEIFAGYQDVSWGSTVSGNHDLSGATFGGRISWSPTRDLIATLTAEQSFTPTTVLSGSTGSFTRSDTVSAAVTYSYSRRIELAANAAYSDANYSIGSRDDKISQAGINATYYFTDSVGVRLEYSFTDVNSNQSIFDYNRNMAILGLHMRM